MTDVACTGSQTKQEQKRRRNRRHRSRGKNGGFACDSNATSLNDDSHFMSRKGLTDDCGSKENANSFNKTISGWCAVCSIDLFLRRFLVVGHCNHTICSYCALRLRTKNNDLTCVICKSHMPLMIVYNCHDPLFRDDLNFEGSATSKKSVEGSRLSDGTICFDFFTGGNEFMLSESKEDSSDEQLLSEADAAALVASLNSDWRLRCVSDLHSRSKVPAAGYFSFDARGSLGFLFFNCLNHRRDLQELRSFRCPVCIHTRNSSNRHVKKYPNCAALLRHVKEAHTPRYHSNARKQSHAEGEELFVCALCLEHRPIFTSELPLYSSKQLKAHFSGTAVQKPDSLMKAPVGDYTTGHPECKFCHRNFFDQNMLYAHMQQEHISCHLCPSNRMFTYYRNLDALIEHQSNEHFVCRLCNFHEMHAVGIAVAFGDPVLLKQHLIDFHGATEASATSSALREQYPRRLGQNHNHRRGVTRRNDVFELQMGNASPFVITSVDTASSSTHVEESYHSSHSASILPPSNMQIAGRVTGTGRFAALHSMEQRLLDEAIAEIHTSDNNGVLHEAPAMPPTEAFPPLLRDANDISDSSVTMAVTASKEEIHPLSMVRTHKLGGNSKRCGDEKFSDAEQRRIERNYNLSAALFGGDSNHSTVLNKGNPFSAELVGGNLRNQAIVDHLTSPVLQRVNTSSNQWLPKQLMRPLYCPLLVNWARRDRVELQKIEKKMYELLMGSPQNKQLRPSCSIIGGSQSVQLKPMKKSYRAMVHMLAVYYKLNSFEYDREPMRYVSLVKRIDSYVPYCSLLSAITEANLCASDGGTSIVQLQVKDQALIDVCHTTNSGINIQSILEDQVVDKNVIAEPLDGAFGFTIAEIVNHIVSLIEDEELWFEFIRDTLASVAAHETENLLSRLPVPRIQSLVSCGASAIGVDFGTNVCARLAYCFLVHFQGNNTVHRRSNVNRSIVVLRGCELHTNFKVGSAVEELVGDINDRVYGGEDAYNLPRQPNVRLLQQDNAVVVREKSDGWCHLPLRSRVIPDAAVAEVLPADNQNSFLSYFATDAVDDWEDACTDDEQGKDGEKDEWEEYIIRKRQQRADGSCRDAPTLYDVKKTSAEAEQHARQETRGYHIGTDTAPGAMPVEMYFEHMPTTRVGNPDLNFAAGVEAAVAVPVDIDRPHQQQMQSTHNQYASLLLDEVDEETET